MDMFLMIGGFLLIALLLVGTGALMLRTPRRFAAACEAFTAAGNRPSLLPSAGMCGVGQMDWLILPAALGISAGYVILVYGSAWVTHTFGKWLDHPLVPREIIVALTWELRIAGVAFTLFGLGATSLWIKSLLIR